MNPAGSRFAADLRDLPDDAVAAYLTAHSGLPGPRANLELLAAAGEVLGRSLALRLADDPDVYLRCAGVVAVGRLLLEPGDDQPDGSAGPADLVGLLTARATDPSWRVREAVAMAAQRVGDGDPELLRTLVDGWLRDGDPLVARAAVAAICEPRLLRNPATALAALDACDRATRLLIDVPSSQRRAESVRVLRQGLGYCWSVAVAGDPAHGLPMFATLPTDDPDVAWLDKENRRKKRLAALL